MATAIVLVLATTLILLTLCAILVKLVNKKDSRKISIDLTKSVFKRSQYDTIISTLQYEYDHVTKKMDLLFNRAGVIMGAFTAFYAIVAVSNRFSAYVLLHISKWTNIIDWMLHTICYTGIASCFIAEFMFIYVMFGNRFILNRIPTCFTANKFYESTYIQVLISDINRVYDITSSRLQVFQIAIAVSSYGTVFMVLPYILSSIFLDVNR